MTVEYTDGIRRARTDDLPALRTLFRLTVCTVNRRDYSEEEVEDWACCGDDTTRWQRWMAAYRIFVLTDSTGSLLGYTAVSEAGELHALFVHPQHLGKGVATRLLERAEAEAYAAGARCIVTEASLTARPFFERRGYRTVRRQQRKACRLFLTNFRMEKQLAESGSLSVLGPEAAGMDGRA